MWNFTRYYPQPSKTPAATGNVDLDLDFETTHRLLLKCRREKVTANSAFSAATTIALYKLALQVDSKMNSTKYRQSQIVNMRRYWPEEQVDNSCGCHISSMEVGICVAERNRKNFWPIARKVHEKLETKLIESKIALLILPHSGKMSRIFIANSALDFCKLPSGNDSHFSITNMGNIDKSFTGEGKW